MSLFWAGPDRDMVPNPGLGTLYPEFLFFLSWGRNSLTDLNPNSVQLLDFCANHRPRGGVSGIPNQKEAGRPTQDMLGGS